MALKYSKKGIYIGLNKVIKKSDNYKLILRATELLMIMFGYPVNQEAPKNNEKAVEALASLMR